MPFGDTTRRVYMALEAMLFVSMLCTAALIARPDEWHPLLLVALLAALALVGERLAAAVGSGRLSTAHIAVVLAMMLLGPGPAVLIGLAVAVMASAPRRLAPPLWLNNVFSHTVFTLLGALLARWIVGDIHGASHKGDARGVVFALVVFGVFVATIALNFLLIAIDVRVDEGRSIPRQVREAFLPVLPGHLATGVLAALLAVAYTNLGLSVLFGAVLVLVIFHYLTMALLRSEDRADQLEERSIHLANLHFGVLSMLMDAFALRDRSTSRHAATVARYANALAGELGCDDEEREAIHTAALLHDIGKFAWPDRVLRPEQLTDEDWELIRRHPQDGAELVGKLDGYGSVADAILYHHERVDGGGYPAGLIGSEIPLASRIIAVCSTYDTMTRSEAMGATLMPAQAVEELRAVSGSQLDGELVESFAAMLERTGQLSGSAVEDADYEAELAFQHRVRKMAQPRG